MPLLQADKVLAHNEYTKGQLAKAGVPEDTISIIPHPTPSITKPAKSSFIADKLNKQPGDVIYGTVGYIHKFKGVDSAIKALKYLPGNYKLAILGGVKLDSNEQKLYDKLADLIISLGLKNRVYITGFIEDDNLLDSYIRECDLLAYPYRSEYYKGVGSGALNLGIANERPIVAYPVTTFKETNTHNQLVFTHSDSYYELARIIHNIDLKTQARLIHEYANVNSWDNLAVDLVDIYKSL
jgi:glycosyltransferase involved in cell wall biosynthesis